MPTPLPAPTPGTDTALRGWRLRLYTIIFESDTRAGRTFDIALIGLIPLGVAVVVADSMPRLQPRWHGTFIALGGSSRCCSRWNMWPAWCACATRCATR